MNISFTLIFLFVISIICVTTVGLFDIPLTFYFEKQNQEWFSSFMEHSIFEHGIFGGGDIGNIYIAVTFFLYLYSYSLKSKKWQILQIDFGFILFSAISVVLFVHFFKFALGRARPKLVIKDQFPFTNWFEMGPQFLTDGYYTGSFPSGHTASIIILITFAYSLAGFHKNPIYLKVIGWCLGVIVFILSVGMAISRSMILEHWVSDTVTSIFVSWIFIHIIYHYLLKIPLQKEYFHNRTNYIRTKKKFFDLHLALYLGLITLGSLCLVFGIRALFLQQMLWLCFLFLPSILLIFFSTKKFLLLYRQFFSSIHTTF